MSKFPSRIKRGVGKGLVYFLMSAPLFFNCTKVEFEEVEIEKENELYENVEVISDEKINEINSIDSLGNITFYEAQEYSKGDILVAGINEKTPGGLLKKIEKIGAERKTFETSNASLDEAIKEGNFNYSKYFELEDFANEDTKLKYEKGKFTYTFDETLIDLDGLLETEFDQIGIKGQIDFSIETEIYGKFNWGNIEFVYETEIQEESEIEAVANLNFFDFDKEILIFHASGVPFQIPGAPIPLVAKPELELYIGVRGKLDANVTSKVMNEFEFEGGIYYKNGSWDFTSDYYNFFEFYEPKSSVKGELITYCKPKLNLIINEVVGPSAGVENYFRLEIDNEEDPWWELYGGYDVLLGIESGWLTKRFGNYEKSVLNFEKKISDSGSIGKLEAELIALPLEGFKPHEAVFDASHSRGKIIEYKFDFNDGNVEIQSENQDNFDGRTRHTYVDEGTYTPILTIKDVSGKVSSDSLEIIVKENLSPTANFNISPENGNENTVFNFDASTSSDDEDNFEELFFRWDFEGDGEWETEFSKEYIINHKYNQEGTYNPTMEIKDSRGLVSRLDKKLEVKENEFIELKEDDGISEFSSWFPGNCSAKWWGEGHVFKKYFDCSDYDLKLEKIKFKIDSKSSNNSDIYFGFRDEEGNDLIPDLYNDRVLIRYDELVEGDWIEKDVSDYEIRVKNCQLIISIHDYLEENCNSVEEIYGTKFSVDNSRKGNSYKYSVWTDYNFYTYEKNEEIQGELMIRLEGKEK